MFEAREKWLFSQTGLAWKKPNAFLGIVGRVDRRGATLKDAPGLGVRVRHVSTLTVTSRQDQFHHAVTQLLGKRYYFIVNQCQINRQSKTLTAIVQPLQMSAQEGGSPCPYRDGLEKTVAVSQASVFDRKQFGWTTINPA
jgi:hypothetical protein